MLLYMTEKLTNLHEAPISFHTLKLNPHKNSPTQCPHHHTTFIKAENQQQRKQTPT